MKSIYTIGKEAPTPSENQVRNFAWDILCGHPKLLLSNPLIRKVWQLKVVVPMTGSTRSPQQEGILRLPERVKVRLNESQRQAVLEFCGMSSDATDPLIQLVHGPPGTGKTTMITAMVQWLARCKGAARGDAVYIVAQSNVAVKNIAEKLVDIKFEEFKLLVSEEFHYEWCRCMLSSV